MFEFTCLFQDCKLKMESYFRE